MKIVPQSVYHLSSTMDALTHIEKCGRTCYKSEPTIFEGCPECNGMRIIDKTEAHLDGCQYPCQTCKKQSAETFIRKIIKLGHESVLEHAYASFRIVTNRFTTHQIVRHRLFSYSQESQRYCSYDKDKFGSEITFVKPLELNEKESEEWYKTLEYAEQSYFQLIEDGYAPQIARSVLPSSTKTEIVMSGNFRSWRHFLKLRYSSHAQANVREIASMIYDYFDKQYPVIVEDISYS